MHVTPMSATSAVVTDTSSNLVRSARGDQLRVGTPVADNLNVNNQGQFSMKSMMQRPLRSRMLTAATAAALVVLLAAASFPTTVVAQIPDVPVSSASVQLSPAVMLIGKFDWQLDAASSPSAPWSRCVVQATCMASVEVHDLLPYHVQSDLSQACRTNNLAALTTSTFLLSSQRTELTTA